MKFSQFGTFTIIAFFPIIAFLIVMLLRSDWSDITPLLIQAGVIFILIVCVLFFYQLNIYIDDQYVSFKLGMGLYGKKYKLSSIKSCRPVRNKIWYGTGIKILPNGILYSVSGLSAIELSFKDKKRIVRIGTNQPNEIAEYINKKIGKSQIESFVPEYHLNVRLAFFWSILALIILLPIAFIFYGIQEPKMRVTDKNLVISGMYGQNISVDRISEIDTIVNLPEIQLRTNGFAFGKIRKGTFKMKDADKAKLFVEYGYPPYIQIKMSDNQIFYINSKDKQKTIELFLKLKE